MAIPNFVKIMLFTIFFTWISFFPQPIQDQYWMYTQIFLVIFLIILAINSKKTEKLFTIQDWSLWLFLICLAPNVLNAKDKKIAIETYFYLITTFTLVFYIGKGIFTTQKDKNTISIIICICGGIVALIGFLELSFGKNILYENFIQNPFYERYRYYSWARPMSTQLHPPILASYLLGCLPFNLGLFKNKNSAIRILSYISFLLTLIIMILTFSRGAFLGLIFLIGFYLWHKYHKKFFYIFLISLSILVSFCSTQKDYEINRLGFNRFIFGSYDSIFSEYRATRIKMTAKILEDHPFSGIGLNHFRIRFNDYCDKNNLNELEEFKIPDNMYLTFISETGLIGITGFLFFIFILFRKGLKQLSSLKDYCSRNILLLTISAFLGLLINMGGYELFYWKTPYMFFCLLCGFISGQSLDKK